QYSATLLSLFSFYHTTITQLYTLSLHDALPIYKTSINLNERLDALIPAGKIASLQTSEMVGLVAKDVQHGKEFTGQYESSAVHRSEEHTSELQSRENLVCRLLLEKKKKLK